jgi:ribulose 1,5-bisphosphate carboxylase large subunit-like protein
MDQEEKLTRHKAMLEAVTSHTSHTWAATIVKQLLENVGGDHMAHQTPVLDSQQLKKQYDGAKKRLMLFDYDVRLSLRSFSILSSSMMFAAMLIEGLHRFVLIGYSYSHRQGPVASYSDRQNSRNHHQAF